MEMFPDLIPFSRGLSLSYFTASLVTLSMELALTDSPFFFHFETKSSVAQILNCILLRIIYTMPSLVSRNFLMIIKLS